LRLNRKGRSFWKVLADHGIFSSILRVPITFPPEEGFGNTLAAMMVPDIKGSQGTFTYYTTDPGERDRFTGGQCIVLEGEPVLRAHVSGPKNPIRKDARELTLPLSVAVAGESATVMVDKVRVMLARRQFSPWIELKFRAGLGVTIAGMCRLYLLDTKPHVRLYMTPINIDPEKPVLPISQPFAYAVYLAKTQGKFCTLGLAEDTWALNEGVLDEEAFLQQAYLIHAEREAMLWDALEKTRRGAVVCVFDITDRLQHMFWRTLDRAHPANRGRPTGHEDVIEKMYRTMDDLVGRLRARVGADTALFILSDHGFKSFRRGVNLNSWLHQNGFLALKGSADGSEWLHNVDWDKTRAYAVGLGGIYLNLRGREQRGTVTADEAAALKDEIASKLAQLCDPADGTGAVREVFDTAKVYRGPYTEEAPDLIAGLVPGYRVSWDCASGAVPSEVFSDNLKAWSGDHCIHPGEVPGVLFSSVALAAERPAIVDMGPTILDLFGVATPAYYDGRSLLTLRPTEGH
jgi:predicted AlkP superfamily phosphohydrolase/phosphomutase